MPNAPYALRQKVEASLQSYLQSRISAVSPSALDGTNILLRQQVTNRTFPMVILECARGAEDEAAQGTGLSQIELTILIGSLATEANAAINHASRVGMIAEWIGPCSKAAILAFCNDPSPSPDQRVVKGILIYDVLPPHEDGDQTAQHWMDRLVVTIIAQMQNE